MTKNQANMKKTDIQNKIESFHEALKAYRSLLLQSRDTMVRIVRNGPELEVMRSDLNRKYGGLSKYIKKLGNYPMLSDIGGGPCPAYEVGLSTGILQRRGPCLDAAIQDFEYILGQFESMSNAEFDSLFTPPQSTSGIIATGGGGGGGGPGGGRGGDGGRVVIDIPREHVTIQHVKDIHSQYWRKVVNDIWLWFKEHVLTSVVVGLIIASVVYSLGWN